MALSKKLKDKITESTHQPPYENRLLLDLPDEIWKPFPIAPFDNIYVVSNKGRVKRLEREFYKTNGMLVHLPERIVKQTIQTRYNNYLKQEFFILTFRVIAEDGQRNSYTTGRIVYYTFVESFDLFNTNLIVRYKDGNGLNADPSNLYLFERKDLARWIQDNDRRSRLVGASDRSAWSKEEIQRWIDLQKKTVSQYDLNGRLIAAYNSRLEAAQSLKINSTQITAVLKDRQQTAGGFLWIEGADNPLAIEVPELKLLHSPVKTQKVAQYSLEGDLIRVFPTIKEAAKNAKVSSSVLSDRLYNRSSPKGFIWKTVDENQEPPVKIEVKPFIPIKVHRKEQKPSGSYIYPYQNYSLEDMPGEEWKAIPNTENTYFASNYGRIKASDRIIERNNASLWQMGCMLHQVVKIDKKNYLQALYVHFAIRKKTFSYQVPKLIYTLFHGEMPHKYTVGFKDNDPFNCRTENLLLRTLSSKYKQYFEQGRLLASRLHKTIAQYTLDGKHVATYPSLKDAAKQTGLNNSGISECANGKKKSFKGFIWNYISDDKVG